VARRAPKSVPDVLAAVDLGSNSFHMVVARYTHGQLVILDRLREMVRLGAGLQADGRLNKEVAIRALACLERFGQRLRDMRPDSVRVVGTNVFRRAKRADAFVERAREAIGHPIEIVSGIEEARLIYSGVSHTMPAGPGRRLVCDIGGGSTEIIIGEGFDPLELESLQMGCVRLSEEFFADGRLSQKRMQRCRVAARLAIEPYQAAFRRRGWDEAVGSSGTVRAIGDSIREMDPNALDISAEGLERIIRELGDIEHIRDLKLSALTDDRKLSFAGGVAILAEVFEQLGIERMKVADGAMREGLLYDLLGRYTDEDARAHGAQHAGALPRGPGASGEGGSHVGGFPFPGGRGLAAVRSGDRTAVALGGAAPRNRPGRRTQWLSPAWRLSAGECRHGRVPARGTETAVHHGRQSSPQTRDRGGR
jgi:exopolyphosphatase/guanosine-5'-triphosphate,3'-diphosphate pyrophosphatase